MVIDMSTIKVSHEVKEKLKKLKEDLENDLNVSNISYSDTINIMLTELEKCKQDRDKKK